MKRVSDIVGHNSVLSGFRGRNFLTTADFSRAELSELLDLAVQHKYRQVDPGQPLTGKSVALVFFNPSLRTRTSMTVAIQQLGGVPVILDVGKGTWTLEYREGAVMDQDQVEHIKEAAGVLARYVNAIGIRCFPSMRDYAEDKSELVLSEFERHGRIPIINLESSMQHPLQGLGDVMTIKEKFGSVDQRKVTLTWAWHPKALPMAVPNSFALAAAQYGMRLTIAHPPEYELDADLMSQLQRYAGENGGSVRVTHDLQESCRGADVVYAKSWGSLHYYGRMEQESELRQKYRHWMVDEDLMARTAEGYFMHCLPVRRNVEVSDGVLDGPRSAVIDQAENRMHIQRTLLSLLLS
ncbi:MAG: N-acetylornithine carbamoyltransferase [Acidobacteria bacterium]|nr:N-acetylornithine carbamoyltransferase [Acidobacteriota bacterium]